MTNRTQPKANVRRKPKPRKFTIRVEGREMLGEYAPD
jgi:hypothetical protein